MEFKHRADDLLGKRAHMKTLEEVNETIAAIEETLSSYQDVDFEWGSPTHRYIDHLERRLEELYRFQAELNP